MNNPIKEATQAIRRYYMDKIEGVIQENERLKNEIKVLELGKNVRENWHKEDTEEIISLVKKRDSLESELKEMREAIEWLGSGNVMMTQTGDGVYLVAMMLGSKGKGSTPLEAIRSAMAQTKGQAPSAKASDFQS